MWCNYLLHKTASMAYGWLDLYTDAFLVIMFASKLCVISDITKCTYRDICILIEWDVLSTSVVSLYILYSLIRMVTLHRQQHSRQCGCCRIAVHTINICGYIVVTPRHKQGYIHWRSVWHFQWRNLLRVCWEERLQLWVWSHFTYKGWVA